jgi:hypothetical protein
MGSYKEGSRFGKALRATALVVMCFFTWTLGGGATLANAAKLNAAQSSSPATAREKTPEERLEKLLTEIDAELAAPVTDIKVLRQQLKTKRGEIEALDAEIRKQFTETEQRLKAAKLPEEILARHQRFVRHYAENLQQLTDNLTPIEKADTPKTATPAIDKARTHLAKTKAPSRHQPLDPNKLPHRAAEPTKQQPRLKKEDFERVYGKDQASLPRRIYLASAANDLTGLLPNSPPTLINFAPPSLDDLAGTVDAPQSPAIVAKAAELNHDPVKIYNWVRNTIEFVPTWGSIQGAQLTLETKQGNAFDTASLLVALLRASGIHARYVLGTVTLPIAKVMNWAGGFSDPMAALDFMSSGGIPTTALTEGGKVTRARFEHVWVEAWIDYLPSRGAKHKPGQGDTWIPLDPSFKQYTYTQGLDLQAAVPFDAQAFVDQLKATATINEAEGYATGVNGTLVQQTLTDYQTRVQNYIAQNYPNATVGDVLGKKEIVKEDDPYLAGTLPYQTAMRGGAYALLPSSLRHTLSFNVSNNGFDDVPLTLTKSLPELAGKKITLSYAPASSADEQMLLSLVGTGVSSIPAYLVSLKPEFRIDGQVAATGGVVTMGSQQQFDMTMTDPAYGATVIANKLTAGTYNAIALDLGAVSAAQAEASAARARAIKDKVEKQDLTGVSRDDVMGEFLHAHGLAYWGIIDFTNKMAVAASGVAHSRLPSEGIFTCNLSVTDLFGMPVAAIPTGFATDIDADFHVVKAKDGDKLKPIAFMTQSGIIGSKMEAGVYDLSFNKAYTGKGMSATHVLEVANLQRIPVYTVTSANISTVLPQLQVSAEVKSDIQNAVNRGKTVTIPQKEISKEGWTGTGYIIYDTSTGAGAYMISGGLAGGCYNCECWNLSPVEEWIAIALLGAIVIGLLLVALPILLPLLYAICSAIIAFASTLVTFVGAIAYSASLAIWEILMSYEALLGIYVLLSTWNSMNPPNGSILPDPENPLEMIALTLLTAVLFWNGIPLW